MTKMKKKHQKGLVTAFLTQKQAMRRLQLSLPNFRRLCILKGVYPVEPSNRKKVGKGNSQPRVFYHSKDIAFLAHEPLMDKFRKLRIYQLKLKKSRERKDRDKEFRVRMNKPRYTLHHIVKERYPTRQDALNDLSDSLNLVFLFSRLPRLTQFNPALIGLCRRLCVEFLNLVVGIQAVRKAFISIKGFYVQVELDGTAVVWIIPHSSTTHTPSDVDYRILATCLEFDTTLVGSILCHLYRVNGLLYPPKLSFHFDPDPTSYYCGQNDSYFEMLSCLSYPIKRTEEADYEETHMDNLSELQAIDDQVSEAVNKQMEVHRVRNLFRGKRVFLMREVPREVICLIIRSCGGECSWDKTVGPGSTFSEEDPSIDFQVVDRPMSTMKVTRYYVQPQWVFDSLNAGRLLPAQDYLPGATLPPHLSPFAASSRRNGSLEDPLLVTVNQRGGLTGVAPGFGEGAALYRPPEADYLAGLVSLAELRGSAVQACADPYHNTKELELDDENVAKPDGELSESDQLRTMNATVGKKGGEVKQRKNSKVKKPAKGELPLITSGRPESKAAKFVQEKAEANAERKLREMLLPKKQRNAYKKMVHSIKRKDKEVRQLTEKRRAIDA
ncbi:pescadillo [Paragonimus westermani]|uniref:Pescadillo homolog n=1 Tax=Paragonimus westermani TaxID=34504 RepID=A0A5J4NUQ3_9TREM|nr:pescadillo [Paragonimus westermani]